LAPVARYDRYGEPGAGMFLFTTPCWRYFIYVYAPWVSQVVLTPVARLDLGHSPSLLVGMFDGVYIVRCILQYILASCSGHSRPDYYFTHALYVGRACHCFAPAFTGYVGVWPAPHVLGASFRLYSVVLRGSPVWAHLLCA
jgi:hypothetical protein